MLVIIVLEWLKWNFNLNCEVGGLSTLSVEAEYSETITMEHRRILGSLLGEGRGGQ